MLSYVLSEQTFVDWIAKSSMLTLKGFKNPLVTSEIYQADNTTSIVNFVNEVPGDIKLVADRDQLFRVLANLVRNASQAGARNIRLARLQSPLLAAQRRVIGKRRTDKSRNPRLLRKRARRRTQEQAQKDQR